MDRSTLELVRGWLELSKDDLRTAKVLANLNPSLLGISVYHCQQCGEKSLKALLAVHEISLKGHDLDTLLTRLSTYEPKVNTLQNEALRLTPFATEFRYPSINFSGSQEPILADAEKALQDAEQIHTLSLMPGDVQR